MGLTDGPVPTRVDAGIKAGLLALVQVARGLYGADGSGVARFGSRCNDCPLREQCTTATRGRDLHIHEHEALLARQRARGRDPAWVGDRSAVPGPQPPVRGRAPPGPPRQPPFGTAHLDLEEPVIEGESYRRRQKPPSPQAEAPTPRHVVDNVHHADDAARAAGHHAKAVPTFWQPPGLITMASDRIDNQRRLRDLAHQLETLPIQAMRIAEGWNSKFSRKPSTECGKRVERPVHNS